ncbi:phage tail family protein [Priestia megaterium]|uniref:phage tail domain-containing protein n=1 Tax=Priestia megaterium TaxID=1404 RepID=UPI00203E48DF|nr:phage tail domain-containing protein [Priestia megaterium]MCM3792510.1 phage tail family protein [Priestia megaterium]
MIVDFYTKDWTKINLSSLNIMTTNFIIDSPSPQHTRESIGRVSGTYTLGTVLDGRSMKVSFFLKTTDFYDFTLIRNEVFKIFNGLDYLYIVDKLKEPAKRWKVKVSNGYEMNKINQVASQFDIEFFSDSPYSESIGTTQDIGNGDFESWQYGQGLITEDLTYDSTAVSFQIYNAGDIKIDPRTLPMLIEVTASQTSADIYMSLSNKTTGEDWVYRGATIAGQVFQLDGVQTLLGGASVSNKTNFGLISLNSGFNNISRNSGISRVKFINRFYYL